MLTLADIAHRFKKEVLGIGEYTREEEKELYARNCPSFSDRLPYTAYDEYTKTWILEDAVSRAAVYTIKPISTVGKTASQLVEQRNYLEALYETFEGKDVNDGQWVVQEFHYNDNRIAPIMQAIRDYVRPHARGTQFTEEYLRIQEHHLRGMAKEGGIYKDTNVTGQQWGLRIPRIKFIVYRRVTNNDLSLQEKGKFDPARELNEKLADLEVKFERCGLKFQRDSKKDVLYWLFNMFNDDPEYDGEKESYIDKMVDIEGEGVIGPELCESLVLSRPVSSTQNSCWTFGKKKVRFLRFSGLRKKPRIGQLTGEVSTGSGSTSAVLCATDSLPDTAILTRTIVFNRRREVEGILNKLEASSRGGSTDSQRARKIYQQASEHFLTDDRNVRISIGIYFQSDSVDGLDDQQRKIVTTFANNNIALLKDNMDGLCLDAYLIHLPMNFKPLNDPKYHYLRAMTLDHAANLSLLFGRGEGSGNPALFFFNRGGSPVFHDPLNGKERAMNAFTFVVGPPGSGKSVTLASMATMNMAIHRPRLFIVEYGNSFGLLGDFFKSHGLTVNRMKLDPANAPSLAPFADIDLVLDETTQDRVNDFEEWDLNSIKFPNGGSEAESGKELQKAIQQALKENNDEENQDEDRDVLGELELICMLMITGGETREVERYSRADRQLIRDCLVKTAEHMRKIGKNGKPKDCITQDVIDTMVRMVNGSYDTAERQYNAKQKETLNSMYTTLEMFTTGFNAKLFNRVGQAWPDTDVTIVDLAELAKDANKDKLAVAYTSLMQRVNYLAEKYQNSPRDILMYTDECHLVCANPLLGPFLVKMVKCFRKLGCWPLFATQNVGDMGGGSAKLLTMIEWYIALNTPLEEAKDIQKVKGLSDETTFLLQSTRKQSAAYTEGVIVSKNYETLFRSSPPSLFLALAMTESHEKAARQKIMDEKHVSELEAAYYVARNLDKARGLKHELEFDF